MSISNRFIKIDCKKKREINIVLDEEGCQYLEYIMDKYLNDSDRARDSKPARFAEYILDHL